MSGMLLEEKAKFTDEEGKLEERINELGCFRANREAVRIIYGDFPIQNDQKLSRYEGLIITHYYLCVDTDTGRRGNQLVRETRQTPEKLKEIKQRFEKEIKASRYILDVLGDAPVGLLQFEIAEMQAAWVSPFSINLSQLGNSRGIVAKRLLADLGMKSGATELLEILKEQRDVIYSKPWERAPNYEKKPYS